MNDKNLIKEALNKNKECCYMLAEKYYYGKGVPADRRLAKEWYEASAKMGHVSAQCTVTFCVLPPAAKKT